MERNLKGKKIRDVQSRMCEKIYKEAEVLVKKTNVKSINRDLFLEQSKLYIFRRVITRLIYDRLTLTGVAKVFVLFCVY